MFAGKKSAQIREILISESAWEEMTCLFAPSLIVLARNLNGNNILLLPLLPTNRFFADNEPQRDVEQSCR
ncbi:hypothetical protein EII45_22635 [Klebsiella pneumoniae]|nr:hypothetical protein DVJ73_17875 [Klebsiella pneumoniae]MDR8382892.1 hypothetical protein [Acinetobacter baumannii]QBH38639.1 hypothetical protein CLQ99_15330 [Klebsiella pneumoniae subsp. pneumoniae]AZH20816.1 hypothetical protein EH202_15275 [Klebsiella pneumoniae]AZL81547.1 hypothetical protein EI690_27805 [Klebsiella pneumoniae]